MVNYIYRMLLSNRSVSFLFGACRGKRGRGLAVIRLVSLSRRIRFSLSHVLVWYVVGLGLGSVSVLCFFVFGAGSLCHDPLRCTYI